MEEYNSLIDYRSVHIAWVKAHPQYFCPYFTPFSDLGMSYVDWLTELYYVSRQQMRCQKLEIHDYPNIFAYKDYIIDVKEYDMQKTVNQSIIKKVVDDEWFITIGFNHQTYTVSKMLKYVYNLREFDWVKSFKAKFEIYRENGLHPHIHIRLKTDLTKSKIIEKIHRAKGAKDLILSREFIDVKVYDPQRHTDYLNGIKKEQKMSYVLQDIEYREQNNIPHFIEKN